MIGNLAKKGASLPYIEGLCDFLIKAVEKKPRPGGLWSICQSISYYRL